MGAISVFNFVTVDGFFAGPNGEIDWFKTIKPDKEFDSFTHDSANSGGTLMFGRATYEMMKSYWPTPDAIKADPVMANSVNKSPKIVFSTTLKDVKEGPNWVNIRRFGKIDREEINTLKKKEAITVLGSGQVVNKLTELGLIDEYTLVVVPIVLGAGKSMFSNMKSVNLKLLDARSFKNGVVVLRYKSTVG